MQPLTQPDFGSQRFKANPFPFYVRLREDMPLFRIKTSNATMRDGPKQLPVALRG